MISNPRFRIVRTRLYGAPRERVQGPRPEQPWKQGSEDFRTYKVRVFGTVS